MSTESYLPWNFEVEANIGMGKTPSSTSSIFSKKQKTFTNSLFTSCQLDDPLSKIQCRVFVPAWTNQETSVDNVSGKKWIISLGTCEIPTAPNRYKGTARFQLSVNNYYPHYCQHVNNYKNTFWDHNLYAGSVTSGCAIAGCHCTLPAVRSHGSKNKPRKGICVL